MSSAEVQDGYARASCIDFGVIQLDPRCEDLIRANLASNKLSEEDLPELLHAFMLPQIDELNRIADTLEALTECQRNLARKRGSKQRSVQLREDDYLELGIAMRRIRKAAGKCGDDILSLIQTLMIQGAGHEAKR